jgi:hypothetical protein
MTPLARRSSVTLAALLLPAGLALAGPDIVNQPLGEGPPVPASRPAPAIPAPATATAPAAAPATPLQSLVGALEGKAPQATTLPGTTERDAVNAGIRDALALEGEGKIADELASLQTLTRANMSDPKAHYFMARAYRLEAKLLATSDPEKAAEDRSLELEHLRDVTALAAKSTIPEDKQWAAAAAQELAARAAATPVLDQYASGGSYPYGYCAETSLRMVLRLEGLADPGPDAVALEGAAPYIPGEGSDGALLAERARELGLTGATYTNQGTLGAIAASIATGRPVMVAGDGPFTATISDGTVKSRSYPDGHWLVVTGVSRDAAGNVTSVALDDPDGGYRETMKVADFTAFFGADGTIWDVSYGL